jgi:pyruvate dehydrogenase E2 component (dihydrolipoamide acetyltransferase)
MHAHVARALPRLLLLRHPGALQRAARGFAASPLPEHRRMIMPKVSPTMTHGRLIEWKVAEGDAVAEGDIIAEVETDKATMPIEAKEEGYMARILVEADTADIPLGQLLAITVDEAEDVVAFKDFVDGDGGGDAGAAAAPAAAAAPVLDLPEHREMTMPKVSPTMTHGRLVEWKVAEGDAIAEGDVIAEVETDKATMPIEAKDDGFMARILVPADSADIPLGQLLAITVEEKELLSAFRDYTPAAAGVAAAAAPVLAAPATSKVVTAAPKAAVAATPSASKGKVSSQISPAVARLLNEFPAIDLLRVAATGPKGIVLKGDVLAAIQDGTAFGRAAGLVQSGDASPSSGLANMGYTDVPLTSMRRAIARRLTESKATVPHRYATATYELDALLALRKRVNAAEPSPAVSVNDFIIRAAALALQRVPEMNAAWDAASESIVFNDYVDVAFAVAIEGGLITPIVKRADALGLTGIAAETKRLAALARAGKLQPDEFEGGSFSTSNLGMFGVSSFSAIINPPQSGILAIGSSIPRCLPGGGEDGTGMRVATVGTGTLSADARVVGEDTAAKFLDEFAACLSDPASNML